MKLSQRMILVLTTVGLLSGCFLAGVGILTEKPIQLNKQKAIREAIFEVVPQSNSTQKLLQQEELSVYAGMDKNNKIRGLAVKAQGVGFQDKITLMYGTDPSLTRIFSLTILEQSETPGLGAKITSEKEFLRFWQNKDCTQKLSLQKPAVGSPEKLSSSEVNTITGATISSRSVLNIVNQSLKEVKQLREKGKLLSGEPNAN